MSRSWPKIDANVQPIVPDEAQLACPAADEDGSQTVFVWVTIVAVDIIPVEFGSKRKKHQVVQTIPDEEDIASKFTAELAGVVCT
eukprot:CAMPEP_0168382308 /NCGR_PEP_ID=MMETSP0228-20121227/13327_1 /TAXON_ID=133427 /ORGANISM="Protoceratium reticulatum, Strain CCCM 535 (=CCMP 1889)" /LENGTH=84 /DNA_ID=CAMNT_0008395437 /DNA_START=754 /DNA_END=1008 /DNA_ORIENTATION=-